MKFPLFRVLKILSAASFSFMFLPLLMVLGAGLGARGGAAFWIGPMLLLVAAGCVGMAYKAWLHPRLERSCGMGLALANITSILLAAGCGWGCFYLATKFTIPEPVYNWTGFAFPLAAGILCGVAFLSGSIVFEHGYGEILTPTYLAVLTGVDAVCLLIPWIMKWQVSAGILAVDYLIVIGVAAFARNQSNIDFLMARRKHSLNHLPSKMRWYSLGLVGGCFAVVVVGFLLRGQIAGLLRWCLEILRLGFAKLLQWLFGDAGQSGELPPDPAAPEMTPPDFGLTEENGPSIFWTIFGWLMLLGVLALLFYYRREILGGFRNIVRKAADLLHRLLFRKGRMIPAGNQEGYYEDDIEDLPREPAPKTVKKHRPYDMKNWRKEYRLYRAMADGEDKVRAGYRLAMLYLLLKRVPLTSSDTPTEILQKSEKVLPSTLFSSVTTAYRQVRYAEMMPSTQQIQQLSEMLGNCAAGKETA